MPNRTTVAWKDGDTMLSFGVFAAIVIGLMALRLADPVNWVAIAADPIAEQSMCSETDSGA